MEVEQLLVPRYMVMADWPDMLERFSIGYIFEHPYGRMYLTEASKYDPADFPHLFKQLEWWEGRKTEDMPNFMKFTRPYHARHKDEVVKVMEYGDGIFLVGTKEPLKIEYFNIGTDTLPATEADYLAYQKSQSR